MEVLLIVIVLCGSGLLAWHMWLMTKLSVPFSTTCSCGHPAAFHKNDGGCQHTHDGSVNCYGYCTCPRTCQEVENRLKTISERV